jgi:hypothetical protein
MIAREYEVFLMPGIWNIACGQAIKFYKSC